MITKLKAIIFAVIFTPIPAFAVYTTMTIEGVKQANGVWTAAGVIDNTGIVRATGTLTVAGTTASTAVALPVERAAASTLLRGASRALGPLALAATAYDVYDWYSTSGLTEVDGEWSVITPADTAYDYIGDCKLPAAAGGTKSNMTVEVCGYNWIAYKKSTQPTIAWKLVVSVTPTYYEIRAVNPSSPNFPSVIQFFPIWPAVSITRPANDQDFNNLPDPSWGVLSNGFSNIPSITGQIPIGGVSFTPFSSWYGDPYFKDGNWYRDRVDVSPCPTSSQPTRVCVDIGPQKFEGATDPQTIPSQATGTATGTTPKEQTDFCKKNPQSIACAELGKLDDEPLEVEERPVDVSYTPWGSSNSQCPADKHISLWEGQSLAISYSPICQLAGLLRPLVIALAFVAAGFIVAGVTRKGGGDA